VPRDCVEWGTARIVVGRTEIWWFRGFAGSRRSRRLGHVYRVERKRGASWYAKYRLPPGAEEARAGVERAGPPPAGYFTKRLAGKWLEDTLGQARRGTLPGDGSHGRDVRRRGGGVSALRRARPGAEALDAAGLPLDHGDVSAARVGGRPLEAITSAEIEVWRAATTRRCTGRSRRLKSRPARAEKTQRPLWVNAQAISRRISSAESTSPRSISARASRTPWSSSGVVGSSSTEAQSSSSPSVSRCRRGR